VSSYETILGEFLDAYVLESQVFFFWIYKIVENFSFSDLLGGTRVCNDTCWGGRVALRSVEAAKIFFYFFTLPFIMYKCFVIDIDIFFKYEFWRVLFWFSIHSAWFSRTWKNSAQAKTLPPGLLGHRWDSREEGIAEPACQKIFSRQIRGGGEGGEGPTTWLKSNCSTQRHSVAMTPATVWHTEVRT